MVEALALLGLVRHLHPMRRYVNHGCLGIWITHLMRKSEVLFCLAPVSFRIHWFDFANLGPHDDAQVVGNRSPTACSLRRAATVTHFPWRAPT